MNANITEHLLSALAAERRVDAGDAGEAELIKYLQFLNRRYPKRFISLFDRLLRSGEAPPDTHALSLAAALKKTAELIGGDGHGALGMVGFFARAAKSYPAAYVPLIITILKLEAASEHAASVEAAALEEDQKRRMRTALLSNAAHRAELAAAIEALKRERERRERLAQSNDDVKEAA